MLPDFITNTYAHLKINEYFLKKNHFEEVFVEYFFTAGMVHFVQSKHLQNENKKGIINRWKNIPILHGQTFYEIFYENNIRNIQKK